MIISRNDQVFNLFDTNGRRKDVINAYKIYTEILEQVYEESETGIWGRYPIELTQFRFYELAIQRSPEVFQKHPKYDNFIKEMEDENVRSAFASKDIDYIKENKRLYQLYKDLDSAIEARARHYSSNLVKIGLANKERQISPIGKSWIHGKKLRRGRFEKLLPIDDTNLMFLRQLLKLRVYTKEKNKYYSPMLMAFYILLNYPRVSQDLFVSLVQMINPYFIVKPSIFVNNFIGGLSQQMERDYIPFETKDSLIEVENQPVPMSKKEFTKHFRSGKSEKAIDIYYEFYIALVSFNKNRSKNNLEKLTELFLDNTKKDMINKAFGFGRNMFNFSKTNNTDVNEFLKLNEKLDILSNDNINKKLLLQFLASKRHDRIYEYGDITRRVMRVTGIISFKNGIVELMHRNIWKKFFENIDLENIIFGDSTAEEYENYEIKMDSPFLNHLTIEEIFNYNEDDLECIISELKEELGLISENEVRKNLLNRTSKAFIDHVKKNYPKEKILEILPLFSDRKNDAIIKEMVAEDSDIPTIFEYIVGIAWYHLSSKKFDLFNSFNLSMNADFEPETHAGGGAGDIVIDYGDRIVMLEVTMMNKQAQKRGEWEPVLRHATNLTIDSAPKEVTTIFIADELDENTINIWRAVATVPLQSTKDRDKFADSVIIMPLKNEELTILLKNDVDEETLLKQISNSFGQLTFNFNKKWRDEILENICLI